MNEDRKDFLGNHEIEMAKGKYYLPVAARVVVFRQDCPGWTIMTQIMESDGKPEFVRAEIANDDHRILATAHKRVVLGKKGPAGQFPVESAETGAVGRALAFLGYGSLIGELDEGDQIADAPVSHSEIGKALD